MQESPKLTDINWTEGGYLPYVSVESLNAAHRENIMWTLIYGVIIGSFASVSMLIENPKAVVGIIGIIPILMTWVYSLHVTELKIEALANSTIEGSIPTSENESHVTDTIFKLIDQVLVSTAVSSGYADLKLKAINPKLLEWCLRAVIADRHNSKTSKILMWTDSRGNQKEFMVGPNLNLVLNSYQSPASESESELAIYGKPKLCTTDYEAVVDALCFVLSVPNAPNILYDLYGG